MSPLQEVAVHSRFEIGLANPGDDQDIRDLLRHHAIPGAMHVTFEREPSFFESCRVHGDFCQAIVARDRETGELIGLGTRSVAAAFLNGRPSPLGYLADLRLAPANRGGMLVARGYRLFRQLHRDGRAPLYTTVIFNENHMALKAIARGRAGGASCLPRHGRGPLSRDQSSASQTGNQGGLRDYVRQPPSVACDRRLPESKPRTKAIRSRA